MQTCEHPQPLFTPLMLDTLLARWKSLPGHDSPSHASPVDRMSQARSILRATVEQHLPRMSPDDQALYARLLAAREAQAWRNHFFDCFDLMARTRGAAVAVLRLHELHRLLREGEPVGRNRAAGERSLARACS